MTVPRFWREIPQRYNLQASRCGNCQAMHFPPREICPTCRRLSLGRMERLNLAGRGRIVEWTRVHKAAPGFLDQVPYVIALIQAEEGPLITGQIVDSPPESIVPGAWVKGVFRKLGQDGDAGVIYYGTKWQVTTATTDAGAGGKSSKGWLDNADGKSAKGGKDKDAKKDKGRKS